MSGATSPEFYHVLRNRSARLCLWRSGVSVPDGWEVVSSDMTYAAATAYADASWDHTGVPLTLSPDS